MNDQSISSNGSRNTSKYRRKLRSTPHRPPIPTPPILQQPRRTPPAGTARDGRWTLEFEREEAQRADPLTGWSGSGDTRTQVRLSFDSKDEAVAYASAKGFDIHLVPAPATTLKLQAYADNFR